MVALVAPVPIENVELGSTAGRSPNDETAALVMSASCLLAITTYGNLVLTGVVEEKTSRVVEVLLARMPARSLLAGKVAGIGLLGLGPVRRDRGGGARSPRQPSTRLTCRRREEA